MDKFVVDIDAVLDEFEESENKIQPPIMSLPRIGPQKTVTAPPTPPEASSPPSPPPSESEPSLPLQPEPEENLVDSVKLNGTTAPAETPIIEKELLTGPEPANTTKSVSVETTESTLVELEEMSEVEPLTAPKTQPVETLEIRPVDTLESTVMEALQPDLETTSDSKSPLPLEAEQAESSAAVKPKTPLKTQSTSSSDRTASPRVSSEQFEEFLRKKSLENAHLLSAHNSPVLQRYRSSSTGLSLKAAPTTNEALKPLEQNDALPPSERARRSSQTLVGDEIDAHSSLKLPESRPEPSSGVLCPTAQQPTGEPSIELRSNTPELQIAHETEQLSEEGLMVEIRPDDTSSGTREVSTIQRGPKKDTGSDSINHGPLKSDASNFYRIVSFDMSAVEVTDDDLHLLEDEVQNDRAPSRRSQDSGASVEPVDPDQIIESEAAENVVNNNSIDKPNPIEDLDNPFDIPSQPVAEVPVQPGDQVDSDSPGSQSQDATTECLADCDAENDDTSEMTPQPDSSACEQNAEVNSDEAEQGAVGGESEPIVAPSEGVLGKVRPMWIHDEDAPICMNCGQDFTIFRRRHHCRACGKVLCGNCCKDRARLQFMDGELARVCSYCIEILNKAQLPPPTVMVPVGVLKKGGEKSNTSGSGIGGSSGCSKSVMFSDGIRPGGDLTDLDIPSTPPAQRAPQRTLKQLATGRSKAVVARKYRKYVSVTDSLGCLPNVLLSTKFKPYDQPLAAGTLFNLLQDPTLPPVSFELTRHKVQLRVKIVTLDCCLGSRVWSFCSEGLAAFGQEEIAFVLEHHADDELAVPRDVLKLYKILYENACRGAPVIQMDHLLFPGGLLSSKEHAGVLFLRTTLQCTQNILTPLHENNYLVAMLILRSEVPWAKLFPLRLLLRLGAELRYYPCPLVSQRFRKAVYFEGDQHSIMSILADFRNYQYTIQNIPGLVIHVVGKTYTIKAPRNRYDLMMKASTTNENILAIGSNFSSSADSHLVCIQGEDGSFQSQTINIASLPVKVTGASFLVFSGALKSNSGYTAKSSIVEDGILVQIGPHDMAKLKQAIHAMENYRIVCKETKPSTETKESAEEEYVELLWTENEVTRNESVISVIDGSSMAGIPSCKIFSGTDYSNDKFVVRWTELFFLASKDTELDLPDPNRLIEATARSMCVALLPHAAKLYEQDLKKVALRISLDPEQFGYELGAGGERLSGEFLGEVDSALVPIITSLDGSHQPMTIELVFYVLLK